MPCPECRDLSERLAVVLAARKVPRQKLTMTVNPDAVEATVAGDRPDTLTTGEILQVVMRMTLDGASAREIGRKLQCDQRGVFRHRRRLRDEGRLP